MVDLHLKMHFAIGAIVSSLGQHDITIIAIIVTSCGGLGTRLTVEGVARDIPEIIIIQYFLTPT